MDWKMDWNGGMDYGMEYGINYGIQFFSIAILVKLLATHLSNV